MKERLVEDWLIKAGERGGLDVAFCQVLLAKGFKILRAGHSPTEVGKDIIAISPDKQIHAYQIKCGDIGLKDFEGIQPQVTNLIEAAIIHPSIPQGAKHHSYLVTTGIFKQPVEVTVQALNDAWKCRQYGPLTLIRGSELVPDFMQLAADFWPVDPPEVRSFLSLYLAEGRGDLDHQAFARFLHRLFPKEDLSKPIVARRIAAVGLFASYLLEPFNRQGDHWSAFCGWTITAAHQSWAAERYGLADKHWKGSFGLTRGAALAALDRLAAETVEPHGLMPHGPEIDDYTRLRNTVAFSGVAARHLMHRRAGTVDPYWDISKPLLEKLVRDGRFWFWGESAYPHFLCLVWMLEHNGMVMAGENLLVQLVSVLSWHNHRLSENPIAGPEKSADEVLAKIFKDREKKESRHGRKAPVSWCLESLIHLLNLRMRRQALKSCWYEITHMEMAGFEPKRATDMLLWHCEEGEEKTRLQGKPQSWSALSAAARANNLDGLPAILRDDPEFALMFMLAYPHRASTTLVKALDKWFG